VKPILSLKTIDSSRNPSILLSFDIEEFDMPFEYGKILPFEEQLSISAQGTRIILDLLERFSVKATFFCTANFAQNRPELILEMVSKGHEIGSHGFYHSEFEDSDLAKSKIALENLSNKKVIGFRMPRMAPVNLKALKEAGYFYNSSINPTYLPGRYNHLDKPRTYFLEEGTLQIPSSVSPNFRFPLFWLSFHNFPFSLLKPICFQTLKNDGYLNLYFHPWEFTDLQDVEKLGMPWYVRKRSGQGMENQLIRLLDWAKKKGYRFETLQDFTQEIDKI